MRFTARPRVGGRRAVGRWRRGGAPRRDRPRKAGRPRPPPEGEGGDEIGFSRTGRLLLGCCSCVYSCKEEVCLY